MHETASGTYSGDVAVLMRMTRLAIESRILCEELKIEIIVRLNPQVVRSSRIVPGRARLRPRPLCTNKRRCRE